jgi:hypothetical protein
MKGCFYEFSEDCKTRFFEINSIKYDTDSIERQKKADVLEVSITGEYLRNLDPKMIEDSTYFLYKLCTYYANQKMSDHFDFVKSVYEYEQHFFSDFERLREFCISHWDIDPMCFVQRCETNIP